VIDPSTARLAVIVILVAACANTPSPVPAAGSPAMPTGIASAAPAASPQPSSPASRPVPTASSASGWPFVGAAGDPLFGPDGTAYLLTSAGAGDDEGEHSLIALDAAGHIRAGWPIDEREGSDFGLPAIGPGGSVYIEECGTATVGCRLHRLEIDGQEAPGWPFEVGPSIACPVGDPCVSRLVVGQDTAYLVSWHKAKHQTQLLAIDATGRVKPGWPVALDDSYGWFSTPQLGSDETIYIQTKPGADDGPSALWAIAPDGSRRRGWPVSMPDWGAFQTGPNGTIVMVSYEPLLDPSQGGLDSDASRTVYSVVGPDGQTLPGWPRGSKGYASGPVVDSDGTIYYLSATDKVYAHDREGEVKAGWPVAIEVSPDSRIYGPYGAPEGTVFLGNEVVALYPDGIQWRYRLTDPVTWPCPDLDCPPYAAAPAFGSGGVVYVALNHDDSVEIVALDHQGRPKQGWPYRLPQDPADSVPSLTVSPDERLYVRLGTTIIALDPDGRISHSLSSSVHD
jgi:hypothetical protein